MKELGTSELDAAELGQRALVAALVLGMLTAKELRGARVLVGALDTLAAAEPAAVDLVVMVDAGVVESADLPAALCGVRRVLGAGAAVALVAASTVTRALVQDARNPRAIALEERRDDAYARARRWAVPRAAVRLAPGLDPDRFARIVEAAGAAGLALVEADVAAIAPALARVRGVKTARARALLTTVALGTAARTLLFVPSARAPKGGLAREKVERLADAWVSAGAARDSAHASALVSAALTVLEERADAKQGPLSFNLLLREARDRWTSAARARGERATASAKDSLELARALYRLAADDRIELRAKDPQDPNWVLTITS